MPVDGFGLAIVSEAVRIVVVRVFECLLYVSRPAVCVEEVVIDAIHGRAVGRDSVSAEFPVGIDGCRQIEIVSCLDCRESDSYLCGEGINAEFPIFGSTPLGRVGHTAEQFYTFSGSSGFQGMADSSSSLADCFLRVVFYGGQFL